MRATARVYWRLLATGFRRQSAYPLAALGGLVANLTFGLLKVAVLFATVRAAGGELHGYDTASMSTYVWLSQGLLGSVNLTGRTDLALRVKDGQVAVDFLRPVDLQAATLATEAGGLRQRLAFDAEQTTAAKVLAAVSAEAQVLDLTVEEPDIEDVVRRIYAASR